MKSAWRRPLPLVLITLAALILASGWLGLVRVPDGSFGVAGGRVLPPGLRFSPPWSPVSLYPAGAMRAEGSAEAISPEGARLAIPWRLTAAADPDRAASLPPRRSNDPGAFESELAAMVQAAVRNAGPSGASLASRIRADLERQGMSVVDLDVAPGDVARAEAPQGRRRIDPIAVIGLDGADWQILEPLIRAGRLPHLKALRDRSRWGHVRSFEPILSPLLWTTVATGKAPDEHGIIDFLVPDPATGERTPITSRSRRVKALWNIFSEQGLSADVIAWWATWPAEPLHGRMVSDRVAYSLFQVSGETRGLTWPDGLQETLRPALVGDAAIGFEDIHRFVDITPAEFAEARARAAADPKKAWKEPVNHLTRILASTRTYHRAALRLLQEGQPDLLAVYYQGIDEVSHRFAHFMPPRMAGISEADFARYQRAVDAFCVYQDELLGELLERLDPATRLLVLSDHGFENGSSRPTDGPADIEGKPGKWHRLYGIVMAAGPGIPPGRFDTATLYDIAPTVLALAGLPAARDMKGRSLIEPVRPLPEIATYEGASAPYPVAAASAAGVSAGGAAPGAPPSGADEELLRNLASLGYIGSPSPAVEGPRTASVGAARPAASSTVTAHVNMAALRMQKGDNRGAEAELREALSLAPSYFPALMALGQVLVRQGRLEEALDATRRAVARSDDADPGAYVQLALLAARAGQSLQAVNFLEALRARRPRSPGIDTARGVLASASKDAAAAESFYRAALRLDPAAPEPMGRLFMLFRDSGREAELESDVRRALQISDRSVLHLNWMGLILARKGESAEAERLFRSALDLAPDFGGTMANLGSLYGREGRLEEAVEILRRAVRIEPRHLESRINLGAALAKLGRYDEAIENLRQARELGVRSPELLNALGLACAQAGRTDEAAAALRESLSVSPDQPRTRQLLAELGRSSP
jgi:predicted AlkP superfamily phosphohydrolase/phosphomutase/Flp pilus assembly protein TadD